MAVAPQTPVLGDRLGYVERVAERDGMIYADVVVEWGMNPDYETLFVRCSRCGEVAKIPDGDERRARLRARAHVDVPHVGVDFTTNEEMV